MNSKEPFGEGAQRERSALRAPAFQALLIQALALALMFLLLRIFVVIADIKLSLALAVILQGTIAALIARWRKLAFWWSIIEFLFPIALLGTYLLHLPSGIFLGAFLFFVALYWSTFRTQVPFYPSGRRVWDAVETLLPQKTAIRFIDIGSGLGGLVLHLAALHMESTFIGVEVAPLPWLISHLRARIGRSHGRFLRDDYESLDFAQYDVVFAYLSPAAMSPLWNKAQAEMRPGTVLLSFEFPIVDVPAHRTITIDANGLALYAWNF